jgi:hypothetical protein
MIGSNANPYQGIFTEESHQNAAPGKVLKQIACFG